MELFHATTSKLVAQVTYTHDSANSTVVERNAELEACFESLRPPTMVGRNAAFYAFDSARIAAKYGDREFDGSPYQIYRVTMPSPQRHPMSLIDAAFRRWSSHPAVISIVPEYWSPTLEWAVWEYLDREMSVIEEIPAQDPAVISAALLSFCQDRDSINARWPLS